LAERDFLSAEDRALLAHNFTVANPEETPNLVESLPVLEGPPEIIAKYHIQDRTRPRLRCAKCGERVHWKGYILRLPDARHALLAERHCGREAFGLKWDQVERAFLEQVSRQTDLIRLEKLRTAFPALLAEIEAFTAHQQVRAYDRYFHDLRHSFGPLSRGLGRSPKQLGLFDAEIRVRNAAAEYGRAKRQVPELIEAAEDVSVGPDDRRRNQGRLNKWLAQQEPLFKTDTVRLGVCLGDAILRDESPSGMLGRALGRVRQVQALFDVRRSSDWTAPALADGFKTIGLILDEVDDALFALGRFQRFTSAKNIAVLAEWATRDDTIAGRFRADGSALLADDGRRLEPICIFRPIDAPAYDRLAEAFGRGSPVARAA
jgi:hypothetical protein